MMFTDLILTIMANDQPGIVDKISTSIAEHEGSWLESHLTRMAGKFVGIVRVSCPDSNLKNLLASLDILQASGIRILVDQSGEGADDEGELLIFTVTGNDRPGIVREVSSIIAKVGVNVLNLETRCESAAMSAGVLFIATLTVEALPNFDQVQLIEAIESLSDDLVVDMEH